MFLQLLAKIYHNNINIIVPVSVSACQGNSYNHKETSLSR